MRERTGIYLALIMLLPVAAAAHHSRATFFDREGLIHLDGSATEAAPSPMGYSTGRWENGDLVVVTAHINTGQMGRDGIPLSGDVEIRERFSLSQDQRRLDYEMTIIDAATFTEPVTMTSHWIWRPGETVKPYNCIETPGSWTTADQSEFRTSP